MKDIQKQINDNNDLKLQLLNSTLPAEFIKEHVDKLSENNKELVKQLKNDK